MVQSPRLAELSKEGQHDSPRDEDWRISLPIWRTMVWKFGIPSATKRGFNNLLRMAEAEQERVSDSMKAS